jgi:hypothetical protein
MSTMPVKTFRKTVIERRRLYISYDCWLSDTEELSEFQITVIPLTTGAPLLLTSSFPDVEKRRLMMYAAGGKANTNYTVQLVVRTDEGQTKRDDIGIRVLP